MASQPSLIPGEPEALGHARYAHDSRIGDRRRRRHGIIEVHFAIGLIEEEQVRVQGFHELDDPMKSSSEILEPVGLLGCVKLTSFVSGVTIRSSSSKSGLNWSSNSEREQVRRHSPSERGTS